MPIDNELSIFGMKLIIFTSPQKSAQVLEYEEFLLTTEILERAE